MKPNTLISNCPAFYYALAAIAGVALAHDVWPPLFFVLISPLWVQRMSFLLIALCIAGETLFFTRTIPHHRLEGTGIFHVTSIRRGERSFFYKGTVDWKTSKDTLYYALPASYFPTTLLPPSSSFHVTGSLRPTQHNDYTIHGTCTPLNTSSLSFLRFQIKESIRSYLRSHLSDDLCYALFASLATGEVENRLLRLQFNKVGLSHTLAISGFHYAWLIFLVGWTLQRFLSKRTTYSILLVIVSLYFFFIGASPALTRAWLAALIILFGFLFKQTVNGLNSLGLALLISLILDPLALFHIGFQFSYLATFALLTLHPYLSHRLPIHNSLLRSTLSLNIAVTLATLPLLLHHFHFFPFLSLFFNLFFPLALTVCLCALLIPFPWVLTLANWYTAPFLNAIYHGATPLEGGIYVARIPLDLLIALLVAIVTLGLLTKSDKTDYTLRIV